MNDRVSGVVQLKTVRNDELPVMWPVTEDHDQGEDEKKKDKKACYFEMMKQLIIQLSFRSK